MPIKTYLYGALGLILLSLGGALAYYKHKAGVEHDKAVESESAYQSTAAALKHYAASISERNVVITKLGASYDLEREKAQSLVNRLGRHTVAKDLVAHPGLTVSAINAGTASLFGAIECSSNPQCADGTTQDPQAGPDQGAAGKVGGVR
jgi:hypothetical protein